MTFNGGVVVSHFLGEYFHPYTLPLCFKGQGEGEGVGLGEREGVRGRIGIGPKSDHFLSCFLP